MRSKALRFVLLFTLIGALFPLAAKAGDRRQYHARSQAVVLHTFPGAWGGWGSPYWGGYYGPYYYPIDNRGKIKIKDANEFHQVYVNGAYAGTVDDMHSIRLDPGRYRVEIRDQGKSLVDKEVYVVTGKTVEIRVGMNR